MYITTVKVSLQPSFHTSMPLAKSKIVSSFNEDVLFFNTEPFLIHIDHYNRQAKITRETEIQLLHTSSTYGA
jgi:hypothetical protein